MQMDEGALVGIRRGARTVLSIEGGALPNTALLAQ
jgi:hypothetical protein